MRRLGREEQGALASIRLAAALLSIALVAACASQSHEQYAKAIEAHQRDVAESMRLQDDATRLTRLGRFDEAQQTAQRSQERELARAQRCEEAWRQQDEIGRLSAQGRYREVEQILRQRTPAAVECSGRRSIVDDQTPSAVDDARTHVLNDTIGGREPLYVEPRELHDTTLDSPRPSREVWSLMMQASTKMAVDDFREAAPLLERALTLVQQEGDPAASSVLQSLSWLAERQNNLPEALRYIDSAVQLVEQASGPNAKSLAPLLRQQSRLLFLSGDAQRGTEAAKRAFTLYADAPESSTESAVALNNWGVTLQYQGETQRALEAYQTSLSTLRRNRRTAALQEQTLIDWHMPSLLSNLALAYWQLGDLALATENFLQARRSTLEWDEQDRFGKTEAGALAHASALALELDAAISLERASRASGTVVEGLALDMLLERKSAILERQKDTIREFRQSTQQARVASPSRNAPDVLAERWRNVLPTGDEQFDRELLSELESVRARRSSLALREAAMPQDDARREAEALDTRIKAMELEVSERRARRSHLRERATVSPPDQKALQRAVEENREDAFLAQEFSRMRSQVNAQRQLAGQNRRAVLRDIQSRLPAGAVLLEMVRYRPLIPRTDIPEERRWGPVRYGSYLIRHSGPASYIDYGEAQSIDRIIVAFRKALARPGGDEARKLGRQLDAVLMQPVRDQSGALREVLIAPEGMLNLIPFGALVDERNRYLIESSVFNYLSSGRDLLRPENKQKPRSAPLIVADPAFGDGGVDTRLDSAPAERSRDFSGVKFDRLPGTGAEAQAIRQMLPDATLFTGPQATETAVKQARGPRVLHVATHGFFLEDLNAAGEIGARRLRLSENPMLRSGLAFAGANTLRSGVDDGVLTALEAAGLDLNGTQLVVLSACETGVGEVRNGEGVFGLRRAFDIAGAETIVMSLWPVADQTTKDLMIAYYGRLTQGEGRAEALRQAQLELQRDAKRSHPFFWASFISSGQTGPIK